MTHNLNRRSFLKATGALTVAASSLATGRPLLAANASPDADAAATLGWRLGVCAYTFNHLTFYETVDTLASLGVQEMVGFNWQRLSPQKPDTLFNESLSAADRNEAKRYLRDAGVKLACCYCGGLADEAANRRLFAFAQEMGLETLDGEPPQAAFDMLERLCDEYQINLAVHNHAKPSPTWQPETLLKLFQGRSQRIGACCDTGHWARSGLNPVEALQMLQGRILTFDLKDVNDEGECVPFGRGKANIRGILAELRRQRFQGVFGIEYDQRSADIAKDLAQCIAFFQNTAKELATT